MTGIDVDLDTQPRAQRRQVVVGHVDAHAHRDALHHFHPVAAGVLRRKQGELLRRRRAAGLTQAELARRAGIRAETLCRIEQGDRSPSVRTVDKIDRALRDQHFAVESRT